jgi:tRNA (guanine9-N1)-methyltransferase
MEISDERPAKIRKLDGESNDAPLDLQGLKNISEPHLDQESTSPVNSASSQNDNRPEADFPPSRANLSEHPDTADLSGALSKSQLKKLKKKQQWEEGREFRKVKRRETNARRKAKKAAEREAAGAETPGEAAPRASRRSKQLPIALVLDCDFDNLMTDKEIMSLGSQLTRCYSDNKNSPYRSHLMISSFGGQLKDRFEGILASTHLGWRGVRFTEKDFISAAEQAHVTMYGLEGGELAGALAQDFLDKDQPVGMLESKDALMEEHRVEIGSSKGDEVLPSGNGIQAGEQQNKRQPTTH